MFDVEDLCTACCVELIATVGLTCSYPDLLFGWMARLSPGTCPPLKHSLDLRKRKIKVYAIKLRKKSLNATAPIAFVHTSAKFS
jgi:hypothetical protein